MSNANQRNYGISAIEYLASVAKTIQYVCV